MTPRRHARIRQILERRQADLTVLMDQVQNAHNLSAIVRTSDAVGIHRIHAVSGQSSFKASHDSSAGSGRWVEVCTHPDVETAAHALRAEGLRLFAAHFDPRAVDFREVDYTRPTALVLGAERDGVSAEAARLADGFVTIPMVGAVASLNVSVAAAVILYEAQRQRAAAGCYERPQLNEETLARATFELGYPRLAEFCRRRSLPYPALGPEGEIVGPLPRGWPR